MSRFAAPCFRLALVLLAVAGLLGGFTSAHAAAPQLSSVASPSVFTPPSGTLTLVILANDIDGDNITLSFDPTQAMYMTPTPDNSAPPVFAQTVNDPGHAEATLTWANPVNVDFGKAFAAMVQADDGVQTSQDTFTVFINQPPTIAAISNQNVAENALLTVSASGNDPDAGTGPGSLVYSGSNLPSGAAVDANTGEFTWTPGYSDAGTYPNVSIAVSDGHPDGDASTTFDITVSNTNRTPSIANVSAQAVAEDADLAVALSGTDADGDGLTFSLNGIIPAPAGGPPSVSTTGAATGSLDWHPTFDDAGGYLVIVEAVDGNGGSDLRSFSVTVNNTNRAPSIAAITNQNVAEASLLSVSPSASDADGDAITYSGTNLPSGAAVDANTGEFTWTPGYSDAGSYTNVGIVADDGSTTGNASFDITVSNTNRAPSMNAIVNQSVAEGAALSVMPTASDADGDALTYTGSNLPSGAAVDANTGELTWTPGYSDAGSYTNVGIVADDGSTSSSASFDITVSNTNRAPSIAAIVNQSVAENAALTFTPSASDADSDVLTYSGSNLPSGAAVNATTGAFSWTPTYAQSGTYSNVTIGIDDGNGGTDSQSFDIDVTNVNDAPSINAIANQAVAEGAQLTVTPSASDPDNDALTYSGANLPSGATVDAGTGAFDWTPSYAQAGSYSNVTVTADDGIAGSASASFDITVSNTNRAPSINAIANQTIAEASQLTVTPTASDPDGDALTYSGANLPSGAVVDANTGEFTWTPGYSAAGSYTNVGIVAGDGSTTSSASFDITVSNTNQPPSINAIANQSVAEGAQLTVSVSATDTEGDAITFSGSNLPSGATVDANTGAFAWTPGYTAAGSYSNVGIVADDGTASSSANFDITVSNTNRAPSIAAIANQSVAEGAQLTVTPSTSDADSDVLSYSGANLPAGATVDAGTGEFAWTPSYSDAGSYANVSVSVDDGNGGTDSQSFDISVSNTNRAPSIAAIANISVGAGDPIAVTPSGSDADGDALTWSGSNVPTGATVDANTGAFAWTPSLGDVGSYPNVTLTADDGAAQASVSFDVTVSAAVNHPPSINSIANQSVAEGSQLTVAISATDSDGDALTYSGTNLPTGATVNATTGGFDWTPDFSQAGTYSAVTIVADDGHTTSSAGFDVEVTNVNQPPSINSISTQTVSENADLSVAIAGADGDSDAMTFSFISITPTPASNVLPTVSTDGPSAGTLQWHPTYLDATSYTATVGVDDGQGGTSTASFSITVSNVASGPPMIQQASDRSIAEAATSTVSLTAIPAGGATNLRWTLLTPAPPWATLTGTSGATNTLQMKPGYNSADSTGSNGAGSDIINIRVRDGANANSPSDTMSFIVTITNTNRAPQLANITNHTVVEGAQLQVTALGGDADGDPITYSVAAGPEGMAIDNTGFITFTPDFNAAQRVPLGQYRATITVTDSHGASASDNFDVFVQNTNRVPVIDAIADQSVNAGDLLTLTATGSDPDTLDAISTWSRRGQATGATIDAVTGAYAWTPASNVSGAFADTVLATDSTVGTSSIGFTITVNASGNHAPSINAITDQAVAEGALLALTPSASDQDGDALTWSGSNLPTGATIDGSTGAFAWTPDYTQAGSYSGVTLIVNDGINAPVTVAFGITVSNTNRAPSIAAIANQTVAENAAFSLVPSGSDADGDALTWSGTNLPSGSHVNAGNGEFVWTPSYSDAGDYTNITLTADDGQSGSASVSFDLTVSNTNRAPSVNSIANQQVSSGALLTLNPLASDADGDALAWTGTNLPGAALLDGSTGVFTWQTSHGDEGVYGNVTLTASDGNGGSASTVFDITVSVNSAPVIASIATQSVVEQTHISILPSATDQDGDALTWTGTNLPTGATVNANNGEFIWTPGNSQSGAYTNITLTANDAHGNTTSVSFDITVADQAPHIISVYFPVTAGLTVIRGLQATDDDGGYVTFSATGLPAWATINGASGYLTMTPPPNVYGQQFTASLTATDYVSGANSSTTITIDVNATPAAVITARTGATLNRHHGDSNAYRVSFDVEGDVRAEQLSSANVSLERVADGVGITGAARMAPLTVTASGGSVNADFDRAALLDLVADVAAGSTVDLVLHVRAGNGDDLQTPVTLTVIGLTQDAAVRAMPNPVSSASAIEYVVPEDGPVTVAVYAADGRLVRSLVHETVTAGIYRVGFNGRGSDGAALPAGVYYLRALIGADRVTQRIAVVR